MKIENQYSKYYKNELTVELRQIVNQPEMYQDEARLAALLEIQNRGEVISEADQQEIKKLQETFNENKPEKPKVENTTEKIQYKLYSPNAIIGFSILFSVLFGSILMAINLYLLNKKNQSAIVVFFGLVLTVSGSFIAQYYQLNQWITLGVNVIGALFIIEFFWKKYIGYKTKFKRKPIWNALAVSIGIVLIILLLVMKFQPEALEFLKNK